MITRRVLERVLTKAQMKAFLRAANICPKRIILSQIVMYEPAAKWLVDNGIWRLYLDGVTKYPRYSFTPEGLALLVPSCKIDGKAFRWI